ncbi:hypothetical protein F5Y06DRAFT_58173 [Hypoxylon sp. FL0890]|nr:hypothetical protein F5Y06DRAFT_58173 [Hypoxylon sp. FL0890]
MDKLPIEILLMIGALCEPQELIALLHSCNLFYPIYNQLLYEYIVKYDDSSALRAICQYKDQESFAALTNAINARANLGRKFKQ